MEMSENSFGTLILPDESEYPSGLTAGYELLECFSEKENIRTLLAADRKSGERCVVKCYLKDSPLYERSEPEALRTIDAPPMPRFLAEYRNDQMRCVLREYVEGETLSSLAEHKTFTEEEVIRVGVQLCRQLWSLHSMNPPVIHRDIKPQNVVIRQDGTAVLIDFGIARVTSDKETDTEALGTKGFASPEQYGFSQTDARSDIYSLGVLLNWLLHREMKVRQNGNSALGRVIARCVSFDPAGRYADASQLERALLAAGPGAWKKKKLILVLAASFLLAAGIFAVTLFAGGSRSSYEFAEPLVEEAVRKNLGIDNNVPVTKELLEKAAAVYIVAGEAFPDEDAFYPAISRWYAGGRTERGPVTDLSDLAAMPNLEQVCIVCQELSDISGLAGHPKLNKVELKHNYIADISVLAGMDHLTSVGINDNPVRDISPLVECPNLRFLDLCDVRSYDPSVIAQLGNFDYLDISNPTESYRHLGSKSILDLRLAWTGLDDLHALDGVTRLERLEIDHTEVTDLTPLALHKGLRVLKLGYTPAADFSVLTGLPQLEELYVSEDQKGAVDALGEVSFRVIYE